MFLALKSPAEVLALKFLTDLEKAGGSFIQERTPPWKLWYETDDRKFIDRLNTFDREGSWVRGKPEGDVQILHWENLFRNLIIKRASNDRLSKCAIIMTNDRSVMYEMVKRHYLIQQGLITIGEVMPDDPHWLIKIEHPSRWVLDMLPPEMEYKLFNEHESAGLFIESGWSIDDPLNGLRLNRFAFTEKSVVLVDSEGGLHFHRPAWESASAIVQIEVSSGTNIEPDMGSKILIKPMFRQSDECGRPRLWIASEPEKLRSILASGSVMQLGGFSAWFSTDNVIWVAATKPTADCALADIFCDAFESFYPLEKKVFLPARRVLMPKLSEELLMRAFNAPPEDYMCIREYEGELTATILPGKHLQPLEGIIAFQAEQALKALATHQTLWKFDFPEGKKKMMVLQIDLSEKKAVNLAKGLNIIEKIPVKGFFDRLTEWTGGTREKKSAAYPVESEFEMPVSQVQELRKKIAEVDQKLLKSIEQPQLWTQRGKLCIESQSGESALISFLTALIISGDDVKFMSHVDEFIKSRPELSLLARGEASASDRGELLGIIRDPNFTAELHYVLNLAFARKFNDEDIFRQAVDLMRTGYATQMRTFHSFREEKITDKAIEKRGSGKITLLTKNDIKKIKPILNNFLLRVGCADNSLIRLILKQLSLLLSAHLGSEIEEQLLPSNKDSSAGDSFKELLESRLSTANGANLPDKGISYKKWLELYRWETDASDEIGDEVTKKWLKSITRQEFKNLSVNEMFMGAMVRPPFQYNRLSGDGCDEIQRISWMNSLPESVIPPTGDGTEIAAAIFDRFNSGHADWADYFEHALQPKVSVETKARSHHILLTMVSRYGPIPQLERFIEKPVLNPTVKESNRRWGIYGLTLYCDIFRLCLAYKKSIDEQRLFMFLLERLPREADGWQTFKAAAEPLILCLFLNGAPSRRFQLDKMLDITLRWMKIAYTKGDDQILTETLHIMSLLQIGILTELVPQNIEAHQFQERRRIIWLEHARRLAAPGGWKSWNKRLS